MDSPYARGRRLMADMYQQLSGTSILVKDSELDIDLSGSSVYNKSQMGEPDLLHKLIADSK
jgi:hypothetical protein